MKIVDVSENTISEVYIQGFSYFPSSTSVFKLMKILKGEILDFVVVESEDSLFYVDRYKLLEIVAESYQNAEEEIGEFLDNSCKLLEVDKYAPIKDVLALFYEKRVLAFGVKDKGNMVGVVRLKDIMSFLLKY